MAPQEETNNKDDEINKYKKQLDAKTKEIGDTFDTEVTPENFGRVATSTAKQVVVQKIREAERTSLIEEFENKQGELVSGIVSLEDEGNYYIFKDNKTLIEVKLSVINDDKVTIEFKDHFE